MQHQGNIVINYQDVAPSFGNGVSAGRTDT